MTILRFDDIHRAYCRGKKVLEGVSFSVRERLDAHHAVFSLEPAAACALLKHKLGIDGVRCRTVALEELFIEILGGEL